MRGSDGPAPPDINLIDGLLRERVVDLVREIRGQEPTDLGADRGRITDFEAGGRAELGLDLRGALN